MAEIFEVNPPMSVGIQALGQFFYLKDDRQKPTNEETVHREADNDHVIKSLL